MRTETIISAQNPKIKELVALQEKSSRRRESGLFVVEGRRELGHCLDSGFRPQTFFVCPEIISESDLADVLAKAEDAAGRRGERTASRGGVAGDGERAFGRDVGIGNRLAGARREPLMVVVPARLYDKLAYRGGTEGIMAVMEARERTLEDLQLGESPLIVVLEGVEKPGNLGAVLRSADAAGADAVVLCDAPTDLYNPNLIRASIGAVFSRPVAVASSEDTIAWLKSRNIQILTAQLQDSQWYYDTDMTGGTAIVMGTESTGLSDKWRDAADAHIRIPMLGRLDSLNVSVAAAILLFEAVRQRCTNPE